MKYLICIVLLHCILYNCDAQDTTRLHEYLLQHRYAVNPDSVKTFSRISEMMAGKRLFVLGEGGSHDLQLYNKLKPALVLQMANLNLKYFFNESGRASAYIKNQYLHNNFNKRPAEFINLFYMIDREKAVLQHHPDFMIAGIDFERGITLQLATEHLFTNANMAHMPYTAALVNQIADTSVPGLSYKKFESFYRKLQRQFFRDSTHIKAETGNNYKEFAYLLSNPNINNPGSNRNRAMADNLLNEISVADTSSVYFLSIGMAHSLVPNKGSTVHFLAESEQLKNRILVMNLFCENCSVENEAIESHRLRFMKDDILACFSHCANSDLVMFDLQLLPPEYDMIREYGTILLFAKNQR